jgi:hypothetical protein
MTVTNPLNLTRLFALGMLLILPVAAVAQQRPPIAEEMAKAYGIDSFGQVEAIRYTFNLQFPGVNFSRTWTWEPKTGRVSFEGKDKAGKPVKVTYESSKVASENEAVQKEINPNFINDQYWLVFPFHVVWDRSANVTDDGMQKLPLGKGSARRVVVKYPPEVGGFTPGDTWELYVGANKRVEEFIYRRGGATKPSVVIATWAGYKKVGPLLISTEHRGTADGKPLHLWFSNVAVKMTGSDSWVNAQ